MKNLTDHIYNRAVALDCCSMFKGTEDEDQLMRLFLTKQGIEFCINNNFPDLKTFRLFKEAEKHNIYIDKNVELKNQSKVVLIGNTNGILSYDDPDKVHEVILMHGAKATIKASGYAVVFVTNSGCTVDKEIKDFAKIL